MMKYFLQINHSSLNTLLCVIGHNSVKLAIIAATNLKSMLE
jgi:hypothetical protein